MCWRVNIPGRAQQGDRGALLRNYRGDLEVSTAPAAQAADEYVRGCRGADGASGGTGRRTHLRPTWPLLAAFSERPQPETRRLWCPQRSKTTRRRSGSAHVAGTSKWLRHHERAGGDDVTTARRLPAASPETALPASSSPVRYLGPGHADPEVWPLRGGPHEDPARTKTRLNHQNNETFAIDYTGCLRQQTHK